MARTIVEQLVISFDNFCKFCLVEEQAPLSPDEKALYVTAHFIAILELFTVLASLDQVLADELLYELRNTRKLPRMITMFDHEVLDDDHPMCDYFCTLNDLICEISFHSKSNRSLLTATDDELQRRLPITFQISAQDKKSTDVLIGQVQTRQSAQDDVGFVMWPSAVVLANFLGSNPDIVQGKDVIELGAGCGLTGIVAGIPELGGAKSVTLTDFNDLVLRNLDKNVLMNGIGNICQVEKLDFYNQSGKSEEGWINGAGNMCKPFDLVVAADIICKPADAVAAAKTCNDVLAFGGVALIICGDSVHRFGVDIFADECMKVGLSVTMKRINKKFLKESCCNLEFTSGYVDEMTLNFFTITKQNKVPEFVVG